MIGWLKGIVVDRQHPGKLVIDVNGVGYDVETSLSTFFQLEMQTGAISLHIHTIVREDALLLYGFLYQQERALFRALIKVNGVGPKLAIAILSSVTPDEFIQSIHQQNAELLVKLPGIGKKTAERLLVEMKDSVQHLPLTVPLNSQPISNIGHPTDEAVSALEALGYKRPDAVKVVNKLDDGQKNCEQLIRQALQILAGR
jgi:Holliday junction DNA helicase RuvA